MKIAFFLKSLYPLSLCKFGNPDCFPSNHVGWSSGLIKKKEASNHIGIMMTSSNGNIFRITGHLCREFTGPRWIPYTKASDAELWFFFFDLRLYKRFSKQSWGWWFEMLSCPLWHHCNVKVSSPSRAPWSHCGKPLSQYAKHHLGNSFADARSVNILQDLWS